MVAINSTDLSPSDYLLSGLFILGFLVIAYGIGKLLGKGKNARFAKAWAPLIPLVNGTVANDGAGADTSWLTGTYQGRSVRASMTPGQNRYSHSSSYNANDRFNYFDIQLLAEPGQQDWKVSYESRVLGIGQEGWQIRATPSLQVQLSQQGILERIASFGNPKVSYSRQQQVLLLSEDVTPQWVPSPDRFKQELDLLLHLASVNSQVNPP